MTSPLQQHDRQIFRALIDRYGRAALDADADDYDRTRPPLRERNLEALKIEVDRLLCLRNEPFTWTSVLAAIKVLRPSVGHDRHKQLATNCTRYRGGKKGFIVRNYGSIESF
jgi:hypothetical protein